MIIQESILNWLLESNPWTEYNTRIELLNQDMNSELVIKSYNNILKHPLVKKLVNELKDWPGVALKRHNDAKQLLHKLAFLTDIGLRNDNPIIADVIQRIFRQQEELGPFRILVNVPKHFGGSGEDELSWMLCDSPTIIYSLIKFGFEKDERVKKAISYLNGLIRKNGWPCAASEKFGKFKGPGRRDDPCPYANLLMIKVLSNTEKWKNSDELKNGVETLLSLWDQRKERKPYLFAMGTDFSKLKTPMIWYDLLHVTDVLTEIDWIRKDKRLIEILDILHSKADSNGFFTAESVWRAWKDWDFGQKNEPSSWITFQAYKILKKMEK